MTKNKKTIIRATFWFIIVLLIMPYVFIKLDTYLYNRPEVVERRNLERISKLMITLVDKNGDFNNLSNDIFISSIAPNDMLNPNGKTGLKDSYGADVTIRKAQIDNKNSNEYVIIHDGLLKKDCLSLIKAVSFEDFMIKLNGGYVRNMGDSGQLDKPIADCLKSGNTVEISNSPAYYD